MLSITNMYIFLLSYCKVSENSKLSHDDWVTVLAGDGVI
jgi:hypothetical protein